MLAQLRNGNRSGIAYLAIAAILAVSGTTTLIRGLTDQPQLADTPSLGSIPSAVTEPADQAVQGVTFMSYATPVSIRASAVGIDSPLVTVDKTASGTVDTPQGDNFDKAAWYRHSPAPGQYGAAVIVGHVDSYRSNGASVFYNLSRLKPGDTVDVARDDGTTASFRVYALREYGRQSMPTDEVYGAHTGDAELRLITCSGTFDMISGEYSDNTVVFAALIDPGQPVTGPYVAVIDPIDDH